MGLVDFRGQQDAVSDLGNAKKLFPLLIIGPRYSGRKFLANCLAGQLQRRVVLATGKSITDFADLLLVLSDLTDGDILLISDCFTIPLDLREKLFKIVRNCQVEYFHRKSRSKVKIDLAKFDFIATSTKVGAKNGLFGKSVRLGNYSCGELQMILNSQYTEQATSKALTALGQRSRGSLATARDYLERCLTQMKNGDPVDTETIQRFFERLNIDEYGLDDLDRSALSALVAAKGYLSRSQLAEKLGVSQHSILKNSKQFMIDCGFLEQNSRKQIRATTQAQTYLEKIVP